MLTYFYLFLFLHILQFEVYWRPLQASGSSGDFAVNSARHPLQARTNGAAIRFRGTEYAHCSTLTHKIGDEPRCSTIK